MTRILTALIPVFRPSARRILVEAIYAQGWQDRDALCTANSVPAPRAAAGTAPVTV